MLLLSLLLLFVMVLLVVRDLQSSYTAQKRALTDSLNDANAQLQRKSTLLATMSHELR